MVYPRTYTPPASLRPTADDGGDDGTPDHRLLCRACSFRPWARTGDVVSLTVTLVRDGVVVVRRVPAAFDGSVWVAQVDLVPGEVAFANRGDVVDGYGEINGTPTRAVDASGALADAPDLAPSAVVPEAPLAVLLPLAGLGVILLRRRGRRAG